MLPHPFSGCGIEEEDSVEKSPYSAGCGFYFHGSGFDEILGESFKAESCQLIVLNECKESNSAIFEEL